MLKENGSGQKTLMEMFDDFVFGPATQEALERAEEVGIDVDAWNGKPVADFARAYGEAIKRDVIAGEHKILDGLRIVPGIGETDMPFYKELGQMKILQELGFDGILLPRFAVRAGTKQPTVAGSMNQKMGRDLKPGSRQHDQPTAIQFTIISSPSL